MKHSKMLGLLNAMAEYHRAEISDQTLGMYAADLDKFSIEDISGAWKKYRGNPKNVFMPTPAQLVAHIDDGRPDANEAWAMIPWEEGPSVVWNDEIRFAFGAAESLYREGQKQSAFFAFKEIYERLVMESRRKGVRPNWQVSFGQNPNGKEAAVREALAKKRISYLEAEKLIPEKQVKYLEKLSLESTELKQESEEKIKAKKYLLKDLIGAVNSGNQDEFNKIKNKAKEILNGK